jgi:acetylornithine deacetylase/succinyl-diaminopimelate desuccinylase-like protein
MSKEHTTIRGPGVEVSRVFDLIREEDLARDTLEFVKVRSETGSERDGSLFFADLLQREGFEVSLDDAGDGRPNVYALVKGQSPGAPPLLFNGHTDTIPIGFSDPPGIEGNWVAGRGSEDMKGGLVAMVHAASALRKADVRLEADLWLTGVVDHETPVGKKLGPKRLIERLRSGQIRAGAIIIAEGPCAIWTASLGSTIFTVTISSSRGIIHTVKVPYRENPACWLGRLLNEFERLENGFGAAPAHALCGPERLNVGVITAGDYCNRLPTPITVTGTWRWQPGKRHDDVRSQLLDICEGLARASGLEFDASFAAQREPFETAADHPVVRALLAAGRSVTGEQPQIIGMPLVGDGNLYANDAGVPVVYYGPAHETAHSDHERVSVSQLVHCAKVYAASALNFCGAGLKS